MYSKKADLMANHIAERQLFTKMIDMEMEIDLAMRIVAYWMSLESLGCDKGSVQTLASHEDDNFLSLVLCEARSALESLANGGYENSITSVSPQTFELANPSPSLYEKIQDKETLKLEVSDLCNTVCSVIFNDILDQRGLCRRDVEKEANSGGVDPSITLKGKDKSKTGCQVSTLNPKAKEWYPWVNSSSRYLFLTFFCGLPLMQNEVYWFFTLYNFEMVMIMHYWPYVERIHLHQPKNGRPLFEMPSFKYSFVPELILSGRETAGFFVGERTMWCKRFRRSSE